MKRILKLLFLLLLLPFLVFSQAKMGAGISQFTPSLNLDFTQGMPAGLTFTRNSIATRFNSSGVLETVAANVPRLDYDPVTLASKGLLIEESRTNLLRYSNDYTNAAWSKTDITITSSGSNLDNSVGQLVAEGSGGSAAIGQSVTVTAGTAYTFSTYLKRGNTDWFRIRVSDVGTAWVNLATGVVGGTANDGTGTGTTATISAIRDGWYRVSLTGVVGTTASTCFVISAASNGSTARVSNSTRFQFGAQLEQGAFPTSYIPTAASAVTRQADVCTMPVGSWYNQAEGTFYTESQTFATTGYPGVFVVGGGSNALGAFHSSSSSAVSYNFKIATDGTSYTLNTPSLSFGTTVKGAVTYKSTTGTAQRNSGVETTASITIPSTGLTSLRIGTYDSPLNGYVRKLTFWPRKPSSPYRQSLTQ